MDKTMPDLGALMPSAQPRLLRPADVAEMLCVSERTLERWRQTGEGPRYLSLSRKAVRYRDTDLHDFIEAAGRNNTAQRH